MAGSLSEELIAEAKAAGMDMSAPVFGEGSVPSGEGVTTDDIIARFTEKADAPATPPAETQPSTTPATPAAETPEPAQSPATPASFLESYKDDPEFQSDLSAIQQKYGNDREALRGLLHASKLVGQKNELAQLGKAMAERPDQALAWIAQNHPQLFQQQAQPEPEPAKPNTNGHTTPLLMQLLRMVDKEKLDQAPETLRETLRNELQDISLQASPTYKKLNDELKAVKEQLSQFTQQPQMDPRDYINAAIAQVDSQRHASEFVTANKEWLFANKQSGPLSPDGIVFNTNLQKALKGGAQSDVAIEFAMAKVNENKAPTAKPAKTPNKTTSQHQPNTAKAQPEAAEIPWDETLGVAGNAKNLAKALGLNLRDMELSY